MADNQQTSPWTIEIDNTVGYDDLAVITAGEYFGEVSRDANGNLYLTRIMADWDTIADEGPLAEYVARGQVSAVDQQRLEQRVLRKAA